MGMVFRLTEGDYLPDPNWELRYSDGSPLSLSVGDAVFSQLRTPTLLGLLRSCTISSYGSSTEPAVITSPFEATDFSTSGTYFLEFTVNRASGRKERLLEPIEIYVRPFGGRGRR